MIARVTFCIISNAPPRNIDIPPVVMQVLYLDPRELRPLLELLFWRFFDEEPDEPDVFKELKAFSVEVICSVRPDDSIHFSTKFFGKVIELRSISCKKDSMSSILTFNIFNCFDNLWVKERFYK